VVLVLGAILRLISGERGRARVHNFDALGALLATGGTLLLVYTLVKAPTVGWGSGRTVAGLAGALALLAVFVTNERRRCAGGQGGPRGGASERIATTGRRARIGDLLGRGHESDQHLLAAHTPPAHALTAGFSRALVVGSAFMLAAAVIGLRATEVRTSSPRTSSSSRTCTGCACPDSAARPWWTSSSWKTEISSSTGT